LRYSLLLLGIDALFVILLSIIVRVSSFFLFHHCFTGGVVSSSDKFSRNGDRYAVAASYL